MTVEELLHKVREDDMDRLRWRLCRLFGVAPWSRLGLALKGEDCLAFAAQMLLDREEGTLAMEIENPHFDGELFQKRKGERA